MHAVCHAGKAHSTTVNLERLAGAGNPYTLTAPIPTHTRDSDGLWQAAAAHPGTTWAVELGFQGGKMRQPAAFQTAFQYLALVAQEPGAGCNGRRAGVCA